MCRPEGKASNFPSDLDKERQLISRSNNKCQASGSTSEYIIELRRLVNAILIMLRHPRAPSLSTFPLVNLIAVFFYVKVRVW